MHPHTHRGMKEIRDILTQSDLTPRAYETAFRIFTVLGEAKGRLISPRCQVCLCQDLTDLFHTAMSVQMCIRDSCWIWGQMSRHYDMLLQACR